MLDRNENEMLHRVHDGVYSKVFLINGELILTRAFERAESIVIDIEGDTDTNKVLNYYTDLLDINNDISEFYHKLSVHPAFNYMPEAFNGLRVIGVPDMYECICWCIIGQQINLSFAYQVKRRMVESFGRHLESGDHVYYTFPEYRVMAEANKNDLLAMKFSNNKADYLIGISKEFSEGKLSKELVEPLSHEDRIRFLTSFRGIGQWTANYVLMKCFQDPNSIPYGDSGLNAAMIQHGYQKAREEIDKVFKPFEGWKSYLSFYLWRSLNKN